MGDRNAQRPCMGCAEYWFCFERNRARCISFREKEDISNPERTAEEGTAAEGQGTA